MNDFHREKVTSKKQNTKSGKIDSKPQNVVSSFSDNLQFNERKHGKVIFTVFKTDFSCSDDKCIIIKCSTYVKDNLLNFKMFETCS